MSGDTGSPVPGRQRSLGASLLDQVLAETLDPAYERAAADRRARAAATGGTGEIRSRRASSLLVAATLVVAGLLAAVAYREAAEGAQGREQVREALIEDIRTQSATTDDLAEQLDELIVEVTRTREAALDATAIGQNALTRLAAAQQGAGVVAVTGPGLRVTLGNAAADADSDPVGGSPEIALAGLVQDSDLQLVVNALWSAGAEAIGINGQRLGPTTAIRQAGGAILVDFRPVASPYQVSAIGDPDELANGFLSSPEATYVAGLERDYGLTFEFARSDELSLPAGRGAELRFARPLERSADAGSTPTPTNGG
ncbi:DUF881 domain-containing protein [Modestobacter lapidis]|nr:DUF881 domain-containing protein [Modestobacter lapidis]